MSKQQKKWILCLVDFLAPGGVFQQMLQARRQPKLIVKLKSASSRTRLQLRWEREGNQREEQGAELKHMQGIT